MYISFDEIKKKALEIGFQDCGAIACKIESLKEYKEWLNCGHGASMQYLNSYEEVRQNPALLMEEAQSIISFVVSYNTENSVNKNIAEFSVAQYSLFKDYHKRIKTKLYKLIECIQESYPDFQARAFVDTAPILEKTIAKECGLGWIGKNSCLISKEFGNKILLGEIVTNYKTDYNEKIQEDLCKDCNMCLKACPNHAILDNRTINANFCNSYHTIENKESVPNGINLKGFVFGCDICLNACPFSKKKIKESLIMTLNPDMDFLLDSFKNNYFNKSVFNKVKKMSPLSRIKYEKLLSNIQANSVNNTNLLKKFYLLFTNKTSE